MRARVRTEPPEGRAEPRRGGTLSLLAVVALAGCTQSFDDLFAGSGGTTVSSTGASASHGTGAAGGTGASGASGGTGGSGGLACPPTGVGGGPPACVACDGCTECEGEHCGFACDACGCACPTHTCVATAAVSYCDARCGPATQCDISCGSQERCTLLCDGCDADLACLAGNFVCDVTCTGAATCDVDCQSDETCRLRCAPGAACLLRCASSADDCDLQCEPPATLEDCGDGAFACNRACP